MISSFSNISVRKHIFIGPRVQPAMLVYRQFALLEGLCGRSARTYDWSGPTLKVYENEHGHKFRWRCGFSMISAMIAWILEERYLPVQCMTILYIMSFDRCTHVAMNTKPPAWYFALYDVHSI